MNAPRDGRFLADELIGAYGFRADDPEAAGIASIAVELETLASGGPSRTTAEFADRVAAAISAEPMPAPVVAARRAIGRRSLSGFLAAVGDAGRVAFGASRPILMRGQAFALLLIVLLGVLSAGGAAAAGAAQLLAPAPATQNRATPSVSPSPLPSPIPSLTTDAVATPHPTASQPAGAEPVRTGEPASSARAVETPRSSETPRSGETGKPLDTPKPGETPRPTDSDGGAQSHGGPGRTP